MFKRMQLSQIPYLLLTGVLVILLTAVFFSMGHFWNGSSEERLRTVRDAVVKAAVQSYALEGNYAPDVAYLEAHYGLQVDHEKYLVSYSVFASNIVPEVEVIAK